jgi:hypothetical protein
MNHVLDAAQAISALGFLVYGTACLTADRMRAEFKRYGLPQLRKTTGMLQIAAAGGLTLGYLHPLPAMLASLGLSLMMTVALGVRLKIKDPLSGFLQALACLVLNLFIFRELLLRTLGKE